MVSDLDISGIVPLRRSAIRAPLPSPRPPPGRSPGFPSTPRRSDSLPSFPPHFVAFAWRYRSLYARAFAPVGGRAQPPQARGFPFPGHPSVRVSAEAAGPPRFLGNPTAYLPCSLTPMGPPRQAFSALRCCLPRISPRRLPRSPLARLTHTACTLAVYASPPRSPVATQDSLPAAGQLCRAGLLYPLGSKQSFRARYISSSLSRLHLAHKIRGGGGERALKGARAGS